MTLLTLLGITLAFRGSTEAVVSVAGIIGMVATHAFKEVKARCSGIGIDL